MFPLISGHLHIVTADTRGNEILLRAVKPAEILQATYDVFRRQMREDASLTSAVLKLFCTRLADAEQRIGIMAERDARLRLRRLLLHLARLRGKASKRGAEPDAFEPAADGVPGAGLHRVRAWVGTAH